MDPRPLIVQVVNSLGTGGVENGVVNLVNRLPAERYRFAIVTLRPVWSLRARIRRPGVPCLSVGKREGNDPLLPLRLSLLFRRLGPALVHTRNWSTIEGVFAARLAGVPGVVHGEHGVNADEVPVMKRRRVAGRRILYRLADRIVAVSDSLLQGILRRVGPARGKVTVIENGVDTERFRVRRSRRPFRIRLGLPARGRWIGSVGRLDPVKGYPVLVRAFARLRPLRPDLRLVIVGEGPAREPLLDLARDLGGGDRVILPGPREAPEEVYPAFDVFALPSRSEGLSNTLLEAGASGLPLVATRVGGNLRVVEEGVTGRLVPAGDAEALAAALGEILDHPPLRRRMGRAARLRTEEHFGLPRMIRAYDSLYRDVLSARPGSRRLPGAAAAHPRSPAL